MKVIFFGTPQFSAEVLTYLFKHHVDVVAVVTKPDKPKGRSGTPLPTPVKLAAREYNPEIPVYQPEIVSILEFAPTLEQHHADLFVVAAYGEIIKQHLLEMPRLGCINLHTSLLPKYRGAAPIQRAIIEGETESGATIIHMAKKMDAGDIIRMAKVPIGPDTTFGELEKSILDTSKEALLTAIRDLEAGTAARTPQDHSKATFAPKIELEDCQINWNLPAQTIHNLVRGVNPYPGAWCYVKIREEKKRLKILKTKVVEKKNENPGHIIHSINGLTITCGENALSLLELQLEGKKSMPVDELLRGLPKSEWSVF